MHGFTGILTFAYLRYGKVRMPLYPVGENLGNTRSHCRGATGKTVQLTRRIYVDAGDDVEAIVLRLAVRIAKDFVTVQVGREFLSRDVGGCARRCERMALLR